MQVHLLVVFIWITLCRAADPTSTVSSTLVWATGTDANGVLQTTQSVYTQSFSTLYLSVPSVSVGLIGMGTISGLVGEIRTYQTTTVSKNQAASHDLGMTVSKISVILSLFFLAF